MNLAYKAVDKSGQRISTVIEAPNVRDAISRLRGEGLFVTEIEEAKGRGGTTTAASMSKATGATTKMPLKTLVLFTRQLHVLLASVLQSNESLHLSWQVGLHVPVLVSHSEFLPHCVVVSGVQLV